MTDRQQKRSLPTRLYCCKKCGKKVGITVGGNISKHRIPRAYRNQRMDLPMCPYSGIQVRAQVQ